MKSTSTSKVHSFAEVIQSSLQSFTAQSWNWDYFPAFGSLVTVLTEKRILFGIVYAVQTGSSDAGRYPFTFQKTQEELRAEQPQIFEFLQTTFSCLIVGFVENDALIYQMGPEPAKMHAFVNHATLAQTRSFFSSSLYLHLIFNSPEITIGDELLLSLLKTKKDLGLLTQESFLAFIETISLASGDDYRKLKILMTRAHPLLASL
jgi:hypothetical protein